jgi:sulfatase modifying factor 1
MNLTNQYIANPKSRVAYTDSLASHKTIRPTITRLRMSDDRRVLNSRKKQGYFQVKGIGFNMLYCPRGMFMMGSDERDDNNPKKQMTIERPFLLGETEVTQELFQAVMGYNPSEFIYYSNSNQRPVEMVTWYDALMFCNKLSLKLGKRPYYHISNEQYEYDSDMDEYLPNIESAKVTTNPNSNGFRLPLEKEWEYASKAGTNNKYAGANDDEQLDEVAWYFDNSENQTHPVKGKRPNEWGFYDMSGNVWELCYDLYGSNSASRVIRGGSWFKAASLSHSAYRCNDSLGYRNHNLGFRVSASLVN